MLSQADRHDLARWTVRNTGKPFTPLLDLHPIDDGDLCGAVRAWASGEYDPDLLLAEDVALFGRLVAEWDRMTTELDNGTAAG
jgi:hypothetical protein